MPATKPENLKAALVEEAFAIIDEKGVEQLSFREIARRLGVSHQAPYKHFASRDHILAAVVARCFESFSDHLEARPKGETPQDDLRQMGLAYLEFANAHPLKYRLMFNAPLPPVAEHEEMLAQAQHAFSLLRDKLALMTLRETGNDPAEPEKHDAIFIWSALHGLASLMQSDAMDTVGLTPEERGVATDRLMRRLSLALDP